MLRTAAFAIKHGLGRRSAVVAVVSRGSTANSSRGFAAPAASSHGGDHHHHEAAHHHHPPPMPPFARLPVPSQKLYEQHDAVFDDGVAPELALDFDCQHISSREALASWLGAFGLIFLFLNLIKSVDPESHRPALKQHTFLVQTLPYGISDAANLAAVFPSGSDAGHGHDDEEEEEEEE